MFTIIPPTRKQDTWGSGAYNASRDGGKRRHLGIDYACLPDSVILAATAGVVTKIGFPYYDSVNTHKNHFKYVQVTTGLGYVIRYMYISPLVELGDSISKGTPLGISQDLRDVYIGITPHVHVGIKQGSIVIDPEEYFGEFA